MNLSKVLVSRHAKVHSRSAAYFSLLLVPCRGHVLQRQIKKGEEGVQRRDRRQEAWPIGKVGAVLARESNKLAPESKRTGKGLLWCTIRLLHMHMHRRVWRRGIVRGYILGCILHM